MANAAVIFSPGQRLTDETGTPYALATVTFYQAGATTTPYTVYADAALTVSLGSVVYTDSAGYPVTSSGSTAKTQVYSTSDAYRIVGKNADGVTVFEHDNCKGAVIESASVGGSFLTQDAADVRYVRNPNALSSVTTLTAGDKIPAFVASAAGNRNIDWADLTADLLAEWKTAGHVFSAGARILFQSTPPVGWTLESGAAYNDAALKFTTTTPTTGGSVAFSSLFASQTLTGTIGGSALSIAQLATHDHSDSSASGSVNVAAGSDVTIKPNTGITGAAGSSSTHTHSLSMNAFNMEVKFATVNIGQKD